MAYPIFFCIFSKYIVLYVYKRKEEKTCLLYTSDAADD